MVAGKASGLAAIRHLFCSIRDIKEHLRRRLRRKKISSSRAHYIPAASLLSTSFSISAIARSHPFSFHGDRPTRAIGAQKERQVQCISQIDDSRERMSSVELLSGLLQSGKELESNY